MSGREVGVKIARGVLFVLLQIVAALLVVGLIFLGYYTAQNTMNINMVAKDAFARRAQAVLVPSTDGTDAEMLRRLFTNQAIVKDSLLGSTRYAGFEITNYYEHSTVEFHLVWPWDDETVIKVTEAVRDISGKSLADPAADGADGAQAAGQPQPPEWENGVYEATLEKDPITGVWKIYSFELIEPLGIDDIVPVPEVAPTESPEASAGPEETASGSPSA